MRALLRSDLNCLHCNVSHGSVVANGGDALFQRHPPPASRPSSDSSRRGACRGAATVSPSRVSRGPCFGCREGIGALTGRSCGTGYPDGRGPALGAVPTKFQAGCQYRWASAGAIGGARSRGRYTWLRWWSTRCESLDCGRHDGARDRCTRAVDDQGVAGQNSVFGPTVELTVTKNAATGGL